MMSEAIGIEIVELDPQSRHLPKVARWLNGAWDMPEGVGLSDTVAWCRELAAAADETILVARSGGRLVGTVAVVGCDLDSRRDLTPWLSSLFVPSSDRGRAIGEALVLAAEAWAGRQSADMLYLYARRGRLIEYYGRLGWSTFGTFERDGAAFELMQKSLVAGGKR